MVRVVILAIIAISVKQLPFSLPTFGGICKNGLGLKLEATYRRELDPDRPCLKIGRGYTLPEVEFRA